MREGIFIGPIIIAMGLIMAAIAFAVVGALLETADASGEMRLSRNEERLTKLTRELENLRTELSETQTELRRLAEDQAMTHTRRPAAIDSPDIQVTAPEITGSDEIDDHPGMEQMTEVGTLDKSAFNKGITQPRNQVMLDVLGHPRENYATHCQSVTQPRLKALLETRQIGPIRVTLIKPALASLERILERLRASEPDIHAALGTAGGLCVRLIRGSRSSVSNHSWGTAIDVKLKGRLDGFGDGGTQFGLILLAELFNAEGWYWGATYNREDSMHFEVGVETLRRWQAEGKL